MDLSSLNKMDMKKRNFFGKFAPTESLFRTSVGILLVGVTLLCGVGEAYMIGQNPYRRLEKLDPDGKFVLEWEVHRSASRITFNLTVETIGYVGFGLRARGIESDADIVIGGVLPGGETYFSDQHGSPYKLPEMDTSQDYDLHQAWENATHTFLSFSRDLDTCDPQDHAIVEDKVSLIWAYGETDNQSEYHHKTRGEYPVHLLNPDYAPPVERDPQTGFPLVIHSPYNEDVRVWSLRQSYVMPRDETTYWCTVQRGPGLSRKHHMIGFEMRFNNPVSKNHLHHMIISKCRAPPGFTDESIFEQHVNQGHVCYAAGGRSNTFANTRSGPIPTEYCMDYLHVSAVGERITFLPPHMGTPIGESPQEYYLLQMHYDNPQELEGVLVDANFDIFYTPQLRKNEGDVMVIRHESPGLPASHLIPPFSTAQKTYSICGSECSSKILPQEGIRITAILLHVHHSGVGVRLRHFRGNTELAPVAVEDNYTFNYQQMVVLPNEAHILPGDQLVLECTTNNVWANRSLVGGFSTRQEMCSSVLYYYNRLPNHMICASEIDSPEFVESFLGIQNITWSTPHLEYLVTAPRNIAGLPVSKVSDTLDWTLAKRQELNNFLLTYQHSNRCPVELYARAHTRDGNGDPVDLEPEENLPFLTSLPAETGIHKPVQTCALRANNNNNSAINVQGNRSNRMRSNNDGRGNNGNYWGRNRVEFGRGKPNRWN